MLSLADGLVLVEVIDRGDCYVSARVLPVRTVVCSVDEIEPRSFSFNNPFGACPDCYGLGYKMEFDVESDDPGSISQYSGWCDHCDWDGSPAQIKDSFTERFWMHWLKNISLILQRHFRIIRRRSNMSLFMAPTEKS